MDKLNPKLKTFFQRSKVSPPADGIWYDAQVLGIKSIEKMMKCISMDAQLAVPSVEDGRAPVLMQPCDYVKYDKTREYGQRLIRYKEV